jgi:predicted amidohydrolase
MKVTVCELNDRPDELARLWEQLVVHVKKQRSELVLLPEMPFCPWFGATPVFETAVWQSAVAAHDLWQVRLAELAPAIVLSTRPVNREARRLNEGFSWEQATGYKAAHHKYYLPNEEGFWEASWYSRGDGGFTPIQCGAARIGFEICTELWSFEHALVYGKEGVHIIVTPRATSPILYLQITSAWDLIQFILGDRAGLSGRKEKSWDSPRRSGLLSQSRSPSKLRRWLNTLTQDIYYEKHQHLI